MKAACNFSTNSSDLVAGPFLSQILHLANRSVQVLGSEGGGEVGRVGGDHDQGEEVPHARDEPGGERLGGDLDFDSGEVIRITKVKFTKTRCKINHTYQSQKPSNFKVVLE